jgi:hypothetical protein
MTKLATSNLPPAMCPQAMWPVACATPKSKNL